MVKKLGLEHERIHCCPQGHILYEGLENRHLLRCPICDHSRYVRGSSTVPVAVSRYFPLIPILKIIYQCPKLAKLLEHHSGAQSEGSIMRSVADSAQWREISRLFLEFEDLSSHLRLALIVDGVCPHVN